MSKAAMNPAKIEIDSILHLVSFYPLWFHPNALVLAPQARDILRKMPQGIIAFSYLPFVDPESIRG
jgi:hypothetical protein